MIPLLLPSCPRPLPALGLHSFHSSLILVPRVLGPFGQGLVFPLPPLSAPGSPRMCPSWYYRRNKAINVFSTQKYTCAEGNFFSVESSRSYGSNGNVTQSANCAITLSARSKNLGRVFVFATHCSAFAHPVLF